MKIYLLSDIHLEFGDFQPLSDGYDVVVLAGDIHVSTKAVAWILKHFKKCSVLYVLGNHEYYKSSYPHLLDKVTKCIGGTNIILLENDSITIDDVTFYGCSLWTDFEIFNNSKFAMYECAQKMTDYKKIRLSPSFRKLRPSDTRMMHHESLLFLKKALEEKDNTKQVVITHHAPSMLSVSGEFRDDILTTAYASSLDDFITQSNIKLWLHGHSHNSVDYTIGSTRVLTNPRGYFPDEINPDFNPNLIIEI